MLDPVPPPASWLSTAVTPFAERFGLYVLPAHVHELAFAFILYTVIQIWVSPVLSTWLFPNVYPKLPRRSRINWDVHVVSLVQSTFINVIALYVLWNDTERGEMNALERVYGYTGACGLIGALGVGYFIWDLIVSLIYVRIFGLGVLAHAVSALCVFSAGFRPYLQYYGSTFILYELSSPFLNIHWFLDKLHMTGSKLQWYNGILLLATFAGCRLFWGTYQSLRVYQDLWTALHVPTGLSVMEAISQAVHPASVSRQLLVPKDGQCILGDPTCAAAQAELLRYVKHASHVSWTLALSTLASNTVLNYLNFYWYGKMIKTVRSRFEDKPAPKTASHDVIVEGVVLDGADILDQKVPEGKGEITENGFGSETNKTQTDETAKGVASALDEKIGGEARGRRKA